MADITLVEKRPGNEKIINAMQSLLKDTQTCSSIAKEVRDFYMYNTFIHQNKLYFYVKADNPFPSIRKTPCSGPRFGYIVDHHFGP